MVRAGTPLAEVEALLAGEGQRLAFEPMDHRALLGTTGTPTIGGVVAANVSGPRRIQVGAARDFALGARFVDGAGRVLKNGGRVMKNVTGYDLVKLMAGSWGTLGVLTEVSLKVLAVPETEATLVGRGLTAAPAVAALRAALGSPCDVTGAAHLRASGGASATLVRIEGLRGIGRLPRRRRCWRRGFRRAGSVVDGGGQRGAAGPVCATWRPFCRRAAVRRSWRVSAETATDAPGLLAAALDGARGAGRSRDSSTGAAGWPGWSSRRGGRRTPARRRCAGVAGAGSAAMRRWCGRAPDDRGRG